MDLELVPSVDDDYLPLDYYYGVVWRVSWRKRVQRDYDYLDYFVSASRSGLILTSMRFRPGKLEPEGRALRRPQTIPLPASPAIWGVIGWADGAKKLHFRY